MQTARLAAILGLLVACVPDDQPLWLIDRPLAWGLVASVVQPGPYASNLIVPKDRVRAVALPLDTLELQWLAVAPPDHPPLPPPIWIVCAGFGCNLGNPSTELEPECPYPLPLSRTAPCRLGEGERIGLTLGGAFSAGPGFQGIIHLFAVGSADPDLSPETCLKGLSAVPRADLQRCIYQSRALELGPPWMLFVVAPALAEQYFVDVPADAWIEPADAHPVLLGVEVVRRSAAGTVDILAADGDSVPVRPGERVTLRTVFADDAEQAYYRPDRDRSDPFRYTFEPAEESLDIRVALTELVDDYDYEVPARGHERSFTVPDDPAPFDVHLYITDGRQGRARATLHLVPEASAGAP